MTVLHGVIITFFVSMVPVLELRGAIPMGVAAGLSPLAAMLIAVAGNMVPVPFIILFTRRVFHWLRDKGTFGTLVQKLEHRAAQKSEVVKKYAGIGLCILVAIPLPGTGAWTGALVAALLDIRLRHAVPAIFVGLLIAAAITLAVTMGVIHLF